MFIAITVTSIKLGGEGLEIYFSFFSFSLNIFHLLIATFKHRDSTALTFHIFLVSPFLVVLLFFH